MFITNYITLYQFIRFQCDLSITDSIFYARCNIKKKKPFVLSFSTAFKDINLGSGSKYYLLLCLRNIQIKS